MASSLKKPLVLILASLALVVGTAVVALRELAQARRDSLVLSCNNHQRFLWFALIDFGSQNRGTLPYEAGVPGYTMLRNFSVRTVPVAHVNCNHGAPDSRVGGWQAVNVPPETWLAIVGQWKRPLLERPIPFAWCGRPTRTGYRVVTGIVDHSQQHGVSLHHINMQENELTDSLAEINRILETLGVSPVAVNVPDGVVWTDESGQKEIRPRRAGPLGSSVNCTVATNPGERETSMEWLAAVSMAAAGTVAASCPSGEFKARVAHLRAQQLYPWSEISFVGDRGTVDDPIIIAGARSNAVGVLAQREWLDERWWRYRVLERRLLPQGDRFLDVLEVEVLTESRGMTTVVFDVTGFYGGGPDLGAWRFADWLGRTTAGTIEGSVASWAVIDKSWQEGVQSQTGFLVYQVDHGINDG